MPSAGGGKAQSSSEILEVLVMVVLVLVREDGGRVLWTRSGESGCSG